MSTDNRRYITEPPRSASKVIRLAIGVLLLFGTIGLTTCQSLLKTQLDLFRSLFG